MADGVNIDWGLLKQPDPIGDYQAAFQAGRALAGQRIASQAMTGFAANPAAPVDPRLAAADPAAYGQVRGLQKAADQAGRVTQATALAAGATAIQDRIAAMSDAQRAAASQAQETFAAILNGLKMQTTDPNQRLAMAQHVAGLHPEFGINPATITPDDVSDAGIAGHVATAMSLKEQLDQANAQGQPSVPGFRSARPTSVGAAFGANGQAGAGEAWERAAFYQRAASLGTPARAIDSLWARYAALHHPMAPMAAPGPAPSIPASGEQAMSDQDLIAALRLHGVPGFGPGPGQGPSLTSPPTGAHALSDQDITSLLEF
jgi:hypothetical protein